MTAYARDRSSFGYGLRKIDRHTGLRRMLWSTRSRKLTYAPPATPAVPASWASRYDSL